MRKNSSIVTLDDVAADNGSSKTPDQWIEYWNSIRDGRMFASMAGMYKLFGQAMQFPENYGPLLSNLRDNFLNHFVITSTRVIYDTDCVNATIVHNYGSKCHEQRLNLKIPVFDEECHIDDILASKEGFNYMRALLGTHDSKKDIIKTLDYASGTGEIFVTFAPLHDRLLIPGRVAWFEYFKDRFYVTGDNLPYYDGRSFGMRSSKQ